MDWQAQGSRITGNILYNNDYDLEIEVSHGPCVVDHNIFLSPRAFDCFSQGNAFVHNLIAGCMASDHVHIRLTPYHFPHSTVIAGYSETFGGDDRFFNNLFLGAFKPEEVTFQKREFKHFSAHIDQFLTPKEYETEIAKGPRGQFTKFYVTPQIVMVGGNAYSGLAKPSKHDPNAVCAAGLTASIEEKDGVWTLRLCVPEEIAGARGETVTTALLGETRISAQAFESPDGSDLSFDLDMLGARHTASRTPGPLASLKAGEQSIVVWEKNRIG